MAEICVFCGKELRAFSKDSLTFDTARQPVCGACRARLEDKSMLDCACLALDSGRAAEPDVIRAYIHREEEKLQARREEDPFLVRTCSGCGAEVRRTEKDLALLAPNAVLTQWNSYHFVDMYACPKCGKVDFYASRFRKERERAESPAPEEAVEETKPAALPQKRRERKPPWEK